MISVLGKETVEDEKQKEWCQTEFDEADDEKKAHEDSVSGFDAKVQDLSDGIAAAKDEIETLGKEIQEIDKATVVATEQRKQEHAEYFESMTMNSAALQLLAKAKDKLAKFYSFIQQDRPEQDQASDPAPDLAFVQVRAHQSSEEAEKTSGGVVSLLEQLMHELEMSGKDAENSEKSDQADYETLMAESSKTRMTDAQAITDKKAAMADMEIKLEDAKSKKDAATDDLMQTSEYIKDLHKSCDFLMQNFDLRKEDRENEVDSLKNAKAILAGAGSA